MEIIQGRPLIQPEDHPEVVDDALHDSVRMSDEYMSEPEAFAWSKIAADAWGALGDGFIIIDHEPLNPDGEALLYMSTDQLELALVASGVKHLRENGNVQDDRMNALDETLRALDTAKSNPSNRRL